LGISIIAVVYAQWQSEQSTPITTI
jgi:hypothetical protein